MKFVGCKIFQSLGLAGRPGDLNAADLSGLAQAEVKWHNAVGEIAGFAIKQPVLRFAASTQSNARADCVAIGFCADEFQLHEVDFLFCRQVTQEDLGPVIHFVGDDVEVTIFIDIEYGRRSGTGGTNDALDSLLMAAEGVILISA